DCATASMGTSRPRNHCPHPLAAKAACLICGQEKTRQGNACGGWVQDHRLADPIPCIGSLWHDKHAVQIPRDHDARPDGAPNYGRLPVGNGHAAAGFSTVFAGAAFTAPAAGLAGAGFLAAAFLAAGFFAAAFLAAGFLAAAFLAA